MQTINIFLDDIRIARDAYPYTKNPIYLRDNWVTVKSYNEFVSLLQKIRVDGYHIGSVSLDHDLSDQHYTAPFEVWYDYTADQLGMKETGLDCAKYLTDFIDENRLPHPGITCHSMNPVGKKRIEEHLMDWMDSFTYPEGKEVDESDLSAN